VLEAPPTALRRPFNASSSPLATPSRGKDVPGTVVNDLSAYGNHAPGGFVARALAFTRARAPTWAGKRAAFFLRGLVVRALAGKPLDVEALGARMRLYPYNNVCEKRILFTPQYFDPAEREFLRGRLKPDFVFLDIGANVGGYTLFVAAAAGPRARVLAIEPQPEIFERLVYNIRQNPFASVKALNCAVADRDGDITLFVAPRNRGETSMRIVNSEAGGLEIRAPAKTLLSIVRDEGFGRIDAIKLDVEGAEDLILEPFLRDAPRELWPRLLLMEFSHGKWAVDLQRILSDCGYHEALRTRQNVAYELAGG
jgi:FkbM family methyltransferase